MVYVVVGTAGDLLKQRNEHFRVHSQFQTSINKENANGWFETKYKLSSFKTFVFAYWRDFGSDYINY